MKKYYQYSFTKEDIISKEVTENDFQNVRNGYTVDDEDLTDYSRLVPSELRYNHRIVVEYCQYGEKCNIIIDQVEFNSRIVFNESMQNHPTLSGYIQTTNLLYEIGWYNPYYKEDYRIMLSSELPYNAGLLGLHSIYFLYLTHSNNIGWENKCKYLWSIINSKLSLFDTGGSQINLNNFKYGDFVAGIISLYDDYVLEADVYPFTKKFFNDNIKEALKIWKNEHHRLFLNNNNFQID